MMEGEKDKGDTWEMKTGSGRERREKEGGPSN